MRTDPETPHSTSGEINSVGVLAARLTWVIAGPLALLGITYGIVSSGTGWLTGLDLAFAMVVGLMLLSRWAEQRSGSATTVTGEPATFEQCRRYLLTLTLAAVGVWLVANVVGNHVLR